MSKSPGFQANDRACPSCGAHVPASLSRCSCGAVVGVASHESPGLVSQAEALYESYLNARMQRAVKTLQSTRFALARDPADSRLIQQMREATREIETLRGQISAQALRIEEVRRKESEAADRVPVIPPGNAHVTPPEFRETQAFRAQQTVEAAAAAKLAESLTSADAGAAFNAAQAVRAERIAGATVDLCPVCRANMGSDGRCRACGYARRPPAGEDDFLSKEEIDALRRPLARG
jgi:hypothetical protein